LNRVWRLGSGFWGKEEEDFLFSKTLQFSSKTAFLRLVALIMTAHIRNVYGAIMIFREFLPGDPLPTRDFCKNMAKIVQLLSLPKFRFSRGVI